MPSISQALRQLSRHVEFTDRYLKQHYQNLLVEARHGFTEAPEWYQSEEARVAYEGYGQLLCSALAAIVPEIKAREAKRQVLRWLDHAIQSKRERLLQHEVTHGYLALASVAHAEWELCDVLRNVLRGALYISNSYRRWNCLRTNRWYHTPYLPDEGSLAGKVYWINPQTRLVLYADRFQLRWRHGRVLFDVEYRSFAGIRSYSHRRREHWCFRTLDDREYIVDVSWVDDAHLNELKDDLTKHLEVCKGN